MQGKTIQKVIRKKVDEWIESITDESLRKRLKDKVLVSGGSIASLLQGQPVNDYDIYLMDMDVLKELCLYYTKGHPVEVLDGRRRKELIDKYRKHYSEADFLEHMSHEACALRNLKEDQIKLFMEDGGGYQVTYTNTIMEGLPKCKGEVELPKYRPLFFSPNAISLSDDVQIVVRFWGDASRVHKTFDFVHATNYWTHKLGLVFNVDALESILTKNLRYNGSLYPLTSIIRAKKFIKRGFNISAGEYLKIMYQISELDLNNMDILEEQLIGVDVAYFAMLIKAIREHIDKDPDFKMSTEYFTELIDRIFGGEGAENE